MQLKINVLTKVEESQKTTFYFIQQESKTILPIETERLLIDNTYMRTLNALKVVIESIHLYLYLEGIYYVYLRIKSPSNTFDINTTIQNALGILECLRDTAIYVEKEIFTVIDNYKI